MVHGGVASSKHGSAQHDAMPEKQKKATALGSLSNIYGDANGYESWSNFSAMVQVWDVVWKRETHA